jgi:hypothetical protein
VRPDESIALDRVFPGDDFLSLRDLLVDAAQGPTGLVVAVLAVDDLVAELANWPWLGEDLPVGNVLAGASSLCFVSMLTPALAASCLAAEVMPPATTVTSAILNESLKFGSPHRSDQAEAAYFSILSPSSFSACGYMAL